MSPFPAFIAAAMLVTSAGQSARAQEPQTSDGLVGAAQCRQAADEIGKYKPDYPNRTVLAQKWQRVLQAMPATAEQREAAMEAARKTYVDLAAKGKKLPELAAVGFVASCDKDEMQIGYLNRFSSSALRAEVGVIDAGVCVAAAEYLAANDPSNKAVAGELAATWTRILAVINGDSAQRDAAVVKGRETLGIGRKLSAGADLYVAQQFASTMCSGSANQKAYLTRWGSPTLMDAAVKKADGE